MQGDQLRISEIDLPKDVSTLYAERRSYSEGRLDSLKGSLAKQKHVQYFDRLAIFAAGSYGRLEASKHSDIDLFFILDANRDDLEEFHVPEIRMLSDVITVGDQMSFPKFSNDGEFLRIMFLNDMLGDLGSRSDDFNNHFTARMLLMLEGRSIFNSTVYETCLQKTIETYFRDYEHHPADFRPTFLINDILRFWKTLCLNYENRRNQVEQRNKIKQKIKNFKLKFSRMLTCFGSISAIAAYKEGISAHEVAKLCMLTPMERMIAVSDRVAAAKPLVTQTAAHYSWFLGLTGLSTEDLETHFASRDNRIHAFRRAQEFGDTIFAILKAIDDDHESLRYLVV